MVAFSKDFAVKHIWQDMQAVIIKLIMIAKICLPQYCRSNPASKLCFFFLRSRNSNSNSNNERAIILLSQANKIYSNILSYAFHALEFIGPPISAVFLGRQCALMFLRPPNTITIYLQYKNLEQMSCAKDALLKYEYYQIDLFLICRSELKSSRRIWQSPALTTGLFLIFNFLV